VQGEPPAKALKHGVQNKGAAKPKGRSINTLTVEQLESDVISQLAAENWSGSTAKSFSSEVPVGVKLFVLVFEVCFLEFFVTC